MSLQIIDDKLVQAPREVSEYTIPRGVRVIGEEAFVMYEESEEGRFPLDNPIRSIILPEGIEHIEARAFAGCTSLEHISLPSTLKSIDEAAFVDCRSLSYEGVDNKSEHIQLSSLGISSGQTLIHVFDCHRSLDFRPLNIKGIAAQALWGCEELEELYLGSRMEYIGEGAFGQCASLKKVIIAEGIELLAPRAFAGCTELREIALPQSLKGIGESCFSDCSSLVSLALPEGLERIEAWAFSWCTALRHISLPKGLQHLGEEAFYDCISLQIEEQG